MKLLLLSAFCIFSIGAFAQVPNNKSIPLILQLPDTLQKFKGSNSGFFRQHMQEYLRRKAAQNSLPADKYGSVLILPQDKMPCLVPNTNSLAPIPNAWRGTAVPYRPQYHPIPNPALPKKQSLKWNVFDNSLGVQTK